MSLLASAVASQNDHGYEAGRYVATHVLAAFQRPPALLIGCISEQYDVAEVVRGIRSIPGAATIPLLGSGARIVSTMAGPMQKGLGVLALRSDALQVGLGLAPSAEQALTQARNALPTGGTAAHENLLLLASGTVADATLGAGLQAVGNQIAAGCPLVGATGGRVFVDDTVASGVAVGLLRTPGPVGAGIDADPAVAARQAIAALGDHPVVAALVVESGTGDAGDAAEVAATTPFEVVREVVGRATPLVGMVNPGPSAVGVAGADVAAQTGAVLVYVLG